MVADKDNLTAQGESCDSHNSLYAVEYFSILYNNMQFEPIHT